MRNKYKIKKRRGLALRKPWLLVYPSGETLKFKTFQELVNQGILLTMLGQPSATKSWLLSPGRAHLLAERTVNG